MNFLIPKMTQADAYYYNYFNFSTNTAVKIGLCLGLKHQLLQCTFSFLEILNLIFLVFSFYFGKNYCSNEKNSLVRGKH